ncbi:unnamed protein product [Merluccius merluccius]
MTPWRSGPHSPIPLHPSVPYPNCLTGHFHLPRPPLLKRLPPPPPPPPPPPCCLPMILDLAAPGCDGGATAPLGCGGDWSGSGLTSSGSLG